MKVGLSRFANLLGARRLSRTDGKQKIPQEITTFGKIDRDVQLGDTLAETFPSQGNIAVYEEGRGEDGEYPTWEETIQTIIHELTHGLLSHRTNDFKDAVPFWAWTEAETHKEDTIKGYSRPDFVGEEPTTAVGYGNVEEGFAESVAMYLYSAKSKRDLKRGFPTRYAIVESILNEELAPGRADTRSRRRKKDKSRNKKSNRRAMREQIQETL